MRSLRTTLAASKHPWILAPRLLTDMSIWWKMDAYATIELEVQLGCTRKDGKGAHRRACECAQRHRQCNALHRKEGVHTLVWPPYRRLADSQPWTVALQETQWSDNG